MKNGSPGFCLGGPQPARWLRRRSCRRRRLLSGTSAHSVAAPRGPPAVAGPQSLVGAFLELVAAGRLRPPVRHASTKPASSWLPWPDVHDLAHRFGAVAVLPEVLGHA